MSDQIDLARLRELLDGEDLSARRKLPWREACALLLDVLARMGEQP